ncbi:FAD-dependent oxidoreductase [Sphingomonas profundi]|uniref:oxidoreductase n=1 Tax=Alterirhizorhabdus profundi TaxID=2681549 RepID=UPI0012E8D8C7|nr:FAD-dependent oxidoreductase [Sphingomonas profundi]
MAYTHVDKPIRLGNIELKNRIVRPAHATVLGEGTMNDRLIAYHEARARGGAALSILEVGSVHPTSAFCLNIFDPQVEGGMRRLVERCKPHGMKLFQQLWHAGQHIPPADGSPPWAPSDNPGVETGIVPIAMTKTMIDTIIGAYVESAVRMERCGLDGVDVHCAHGYLPSQFLSANINKREDEYGGSFENRARFIMELLAAIRSAVSRDFVVGVRVAPDLTVGGVGVDENLRVAQMLEARGLIDYVNVSVGNYNSYTKMVGGMHEPTGYEMPTSEPITRHITLPTMVIGRYRTLEECDQVIREGAADMIGLVRAMIADPDLVNKSLAGNADRVRPCIACNQACVANAVYLWQGGLRCTVNVGAGNEQSLGDANLESAAEPKTVLVVGGGPAGMEAARVAAMRGHKVILAEADAALGGTLRAATKAPTRHTMFDIATWLEEEIYRLGVDVRLSTYMDENDVIDTGADAVIVATGSMPRMDGVQGSHPGQPIRGMDRGGVLSSTELMLYPPADLGRTAVVIDDVGHYEGLAAAEQLISRGLSVTYVTRLRMLAPAVQGALMVEPFLTRMANRPFAYRIRHRAIAIQPGTVVIGPTHLTEDDVDTERLDADTVVVVTANRPNREIHTALKERNSDIRLVGDANSPRFLETAIREGHLAGASV